jgi:hypothetical protein
VHSGRSAGRRRAGEPRALAQPVRRSPGRRTGLGPVAAGHCPPASVTVTVAAGNWHC